MAEGLRKDDRRPIREEDLTIADGVDRRGLRHQGEDDPHPRGPRGARHGPAGAVAMERMFPAVALPLAGGVGPAVRPCPPWVTHRPP